MGDDSENKLYKSINCVDQCSMMVHDDCIKEYIKDNKQYYCSNCNERYDIKTTMIRKIRFLGEMRDENDYSVIDITVNLICLVIVAIGSFFTPSLYPILAVISSMVAHRTLNNTFILDDIIFNIDELGFNDRMWSFFKPINYDDHVLFYGYLMTNDTYSLLRSFIMVLSNSMMFSGMVCYIVTVVIDQYIEALVIIILVGLGARLALLLVHVILGVIFLSITYIIHKLPRPHNHDIGVYNEHVPLLAEV